MATRMLIAISRRLGSSRVQARKESVTSFNSCVLGVVAELLEVGDISKSIGYERHCTGAVARIVTQQGVS
ncbi:MAG: hypothetical protein ACI955_002821 [Zhongshania sp.]|jgi:hypothetical protein